MFQPWSWRRRQWLFFGLGLLVLASEFGLISWGHVEWGLERLAGDDPNIAPDVGRGEALFIVFGFLLLTPIAAAVLVCLPMFVVAAVAMSLHQTVGIPLRVTTPAVWLLLAAGAALTAPQWLPWVNWVGQLVASAILVARG